MDATVSYKLLPPIVNGTPKIMKDLKFHSSLLPSVMNFLCSPPIRLHVPWNHSFIHACMHLFFHVFFCQIITRCKLTRLYGTSAAAESTCPAPRNPQSCLGQRWALDSVQSKINLSWDVYKRSWNRLSLFMLFAWLCFHFLCGYVSIEVVSKYLPLSKREKEQKHYLLPKKKNETKRISDKRRVDVSLLERDPSPPQARTQPSTQGDINWYLRTE